MKILFVIPILGGGGAEILLGTIVEELYKEGHTVKIACLKGHHDTYKNFPNKKFIDSTIKPIIINCNVSFKLFSKTSINNKEYVKLVNEFRPEIIHSNLYESELLTYSYIRKEIKYFSHIHDNIPQLNRLTLKIFFSKKLFANYYESLWLKSKYLKAKASFISISSDTNQYIYKNLPRSLRTRIFIVPNAIRLERFSRKQENKEITLVSVGNLVGKKGHDFLIETIKKLYEKDINAHLYILGYGDLEDLLKQKANNYGISHLIHFEGNVQNVEYYLQNAHIYVHGASYEPFGLAIIEAMASGLPVVSTDGIGNRDLIENGVNGFLLQERNPNKMACIIEDLLGNKKLRHEMGINAKEFSKKFGISTYVKNLIGLYQS